MKKKKINPLKRYEQFSLAIIIIMAVLLAMSGFRGDRQIYLIWYIPWLIWLAGTMVALVFFFWVRRLVFKIDESAKDYLSDFVTVVKNVFLSVLIGASSFAWIFYQINRRVAESSEKITVPCKITGISRASRGTSYTVSYQFMGRNRVMSSVYADDIRQLYDTGSGFENYQLVLEVQEGMWKSWVVRNWEVERKDFTKLWPQISLP